MAVKHVTKTLGGRKVREINAHKGRITSNDAEEGCCWCEEPAHASECLGNGTFLLEDSGAPPTDYVLDVAGPHSVNTGGCSPPAHSAGWAIFAGTITLTITLVNTSASCVSALNWYVNGSFVGSMTLDSSTPVGTTDSFHVGQRDFWGIEFVGCSGIPSSPFATGCPPCLKPISKVLTDDIYTVSPATPGIALGDCTACEWTSGHFNNTAIDPPGQVTRLSGEVCHWGTSGSTSIFYHMLGGRVAIRDEVTRSGCAMFLSRYCKTNPTGETLVWAGTKSGLDPAGSYTRTGGCDTTGSVTLA